MVLDGRALFPTGAHLVMWTCCGCGFQGGGNLGVRIDHKFQVGGNQGVGIDDNINVSLH